PNCFIFCSPFLRSEFDRWNHSFANNNNRSGSQKPQPKTLAPPTELRNASFPLITRPRLITPPALADPVSSGRKAPRRFHGGSTGHTRLPRLICFDSVRSNGDGA
ncbi:hypothetical protein BC938DRAFT_479365, partial [Jimgerdemannia flammicorona]